LVVDEAFADTVYDPDGAYEPTSLAHRRDLPGLVVVRSLTKTWGLAGLRVGYLLGEAAVLAACAQAQPLWPVSTPALAAVLACTTGQARHEAARFAAALAVDRAYLVDALRTLPKVSVGAAPQSSFVLMKVHDGLSTWEELRAHGFAVRRGDTFPGLGPQWLRVAVRDAETTDAFITALAQSLRSAASPVR
jgi:histidinol-phosphate aminotransferase